MGVRSIHMDTGLGSLSSIQSPVQCTYGITLDRLVCLYRPFLVIEMGAHRGGFRHIRVLYLCERIPHSPNGTSSSPSLWYISSTISSGGLAREQDIHHPHCPLPRSRRLHLQGDVLQLLRREDRCARPHPISFGPSQHVRGHAFLIHVHTRGNNSRSDS